MLVTFVGDCVFYSNRIVLQEEINMYYDENSISVSGRDPPKPALTFDEINFSGKVVFCNKTVLEFIMIIRQNLVRIYL